MKMHGIPPLQEFLGLFFDEANCKRFLFESGIFYNARDCPSCNVPMTPYASQESFMCPKKICRKKISFRANTFFANSHLLCSKVMHLGYLWLTKNPAQAAATQVGVSEQAVADYYGYFRQLVAGDVEPKDTVIGGEGIVIELDESKLGKRKYNRGHRVEGVWVFGGVERTPQRRTFIVPVQDRSADTLLSIISEHVLPGSIIQTDLWRSYVGIESKLGFIHRTVNHRQGFINHADGTHTNTIEGIWNGLKISVPPRNRCTNGIEKQIAEYQWKRLHKKDRWTSFICALRNTHYD